MKSAGFMSDRLALAALDYGLVTHVAQASCDRGPLDDGDCPTPLIAAKK
jgi:hypothetical protein